MKNISKKQKIRIWEIVMKLAFTATLADLFYIIARVTAPVKTLEDASFICHVPQMLEVILLSAVLITAFSAAAAYIIREDDVREK